MLLGLSLLAFIGFSAVSVPKLTNVHFGDLEFTGWSGPMGSRLLDGDVPYRDFVLPIPPGSFAMLALVERLTGEPRLIHELWLNAVIHALLGLIAYAIAAPITSRFNAALVAATTLVALTYLNKECAYDHTAQLWSWGALALGLRGVLASGKSRRRWWMGAGLAAGCTFFFKQSTGVGAIGGWSVGLVYLAAVELFSGRYRGARERGRDAEHFALGAGAGLLLVWLFVVALGSSFGEYFTAVFRDGSELKGGTMALLGNVLSYVARYNAFPASLGFVFLLGAVGVRILAKQGWHLGDEPSRTNPTGPAPWLLATAVLATFGGAAALLNARLPPFQPKVVYYFDSLDRLPAFGLAFGIAFFVFHLQKVGPEPDDGVVADPRRVGHLLNALMLAALVSSILHNTSAPEFRPFYDNNPVIPVALMMLFVAFDRAELPKVKAAVVVLALASLFGDRFARSMEATTRVGSVGHWAGLRVSERGADMVRVAVRVQELAGPAGTVLVLPEDVQLTALIGKNRPPLRGAIAFVDQYPASVLAHDVDVLDANPPQVIVVHPADAFKWMRFYRIWSGDSAAESLLKHVTGKLLPEHYVLDSSHETRFHADADRLDIWVRK